MSTNASKRIAGLDLIRLVACLFVCIVHFNAAVCTYQNGTFVYGSNAIVPNFLLGNRIYLGTLGVKLFFLVSGASLVLSHRPEESALDFYKRRVLNIYPAFWIAFLTATMVDFLLYKGMVAAHPMNLLISFAGLDGYLSALGMIPWEYYKVGEWFLGCILLLYLVYPLMHSFLERFPRTACICFGLLYLFSLYAIDHRLPYIGSSNGVTICACEMFAGMVYAKCSRHGKSKIALWTVILITAVLLRNRIPSDLLTLCLALFLLEGTVQLGECIQSDGVKKRLAWASGLTFPIFLVHHFYIDKIVQGFYLVEMPRVYVYMLFLAYVLGMLALASLLKRLAAPVSLFIRQHDRVLALVLVLLVLSFGYTTWEIMDYQEERVAQSTAFVPDNSAEFPRELNF